MIRHGLIKRPTKSTQGLDCLYYYTLIAPEELRCMIVILFPSLNPTRPRGGEVLIRVTHDGRDRSRLEINVTRNM